MLFLQRTLGIPILLFIVWPTVAHSQEEKEVTFKFRTFGLIGTQAQLFYRGNEKGVWVVREQFSASHSYTGPRMIRFYTSPLLEGDDYEPQPPQETGEESSDPVGALPPKPEPKLQLAMEIPAPENMERALLIVYPGRGGGSGRLNGVFIDDSITRTATRNVHFYNLSQIPMTVKSFEEIKEVPALGLARWDVQEDESVSSLMIAVSAPRQQLIYTNRFRVRPDQRVVFFARNGREGSNDGVPNVTVSSLLQGLRDYEEVFSDDETSTAE